MGEQGMSLLSLPSELLLHVLSFLDFKSILRCSTVCHEINKLAKDEIYWKAQCRVHWDQEINPDGMTWRDYFILWYNDLGHYMGIYNRVRKTWNQIESYTKNNSPNIYDSLNVGASEDELNLIEEWLQLKLPDDLRCIYRIHNGQNWNEEEPPVAGLFGTIHNYEHVRNERMLQLKEILSLGSEDERRLGMVPITRCEFSGVSQFLCVSDSGGFDSGSIYYASGFPINAPLAEKNCFVSGKSYIDWFAKYADEVSAEAFPLVSQQPKVYIYRFYQEPGCVAVTGHVRVTVATAFIPEMSSAIPPTFTFAYRITMSMDADVAPRHACRLETRHWVITDSRGKKSHVNGPGVIGEYPIIKPGIVYSYVSCTNFKTHHGEMKGTYTFRNLATSEPLEVVVPLFHMTCPEILTVEDRKRTTEEKMRL